MKRDSVTTSQQVIYASTTPAEITAYLDKKFPGVTDRVDRDDLRAIVLSSTALALDAANSRIIDEQMKKVEEVWEDPIDSLKSALNRLLEETSDKYALAEDEEE